MQNEELCRIKHNMVITRPKKTQDQVQKEARVAFRKADRFGTVAACTGSGKTKIAVDESAEVVLENPSARILIVVPTQKLRDENWLDEYTQWGHKEIYENNTTRCCYVSLAKFVNQKWDLVVLDEGHHITVASLEFFENNDVESLLVLTATFPKKGEKKEILEAIAPSCYVYTLAEGVYDGIIDPFEVHVIFTELNARSKTVKGGNKNKVFYQTEFSAYNYIETQYNKLKGAYFTANDDWRATKIKHRCFPDQVTQEELVKVQKAKDNSFFVWQRYIGIRTRFIKGLKSKTDAGKAILNRFKVDSERWIVFCGSIEQTAELCGESVYHSKLKDKVKDANYAAFKNEEVSILGAVDAINEGHNIPNIDHILAAQINAQELNIIQRTGRAVRKKKNRVNRTAIVRIICCRDTPDQGWVESALENFDDSIISYHEFDEYIL